MYGIPVFREPKFSIEDSLISVLKSLNGTSTKDIKSITETNGYRLGDSEKIEKVRISKEFNAHLDEVFGIYSDVELDDFYNNSKASLSNYPIAKDFCYINYKFGNYPEGHIGKSFHDEIVVPDLIKSLEDMAYDCLNISKRTAAISILNNLETIEGEAKVNLQNVIAEMTEALDVETFNAKFFSEENIKNVVYNATKIVEKEKEKEKEKEIELDF